MCGWTDKRNSIMTDVLTGVKMIKMFCWEDPFSQMVEESRKSVSMPNYTTTDLVHLAYLIAIAI